MHLVQKTNHQKRNRKNESLFYPMCILFFHCALFSFKNPWSLLVSHPESVTLIPANFVVNDWDELPQNLAKTILPIVVPDSSFLCALRRLSAFIGDNTSVNVLFILLLSIRSAIVFSK